MDDRGLSSLKTPLLVLAVLILVWSVLGALDVQNFTDNGYATDGNNTITQITEGGPADRAGFEVGDYIRSIGGISVEDTRAAARRGRAEAGEVREFEVERDGRLANLNLTYMPQSSAQLAAAYGIIAVGLLFLVSGVFAFVAAPGSATGLLALLGLAFASAFAGGPYFSSPGIRTGVGVVTFVLITVGFAVMAHFILVTSKKNRTLERNRTVWLLYGPAALVCMLSCWLLVFQPPATSAVNVFFRFLFGLFVVAYFGTCLIALIRGHVKATPEMRTSRGLNLMLIGAGIGLAPSIVISAVGIVAPQVVVPGAQLVPLGIGLMPVMFAVAAVRGERAAEVRA